MLQAQLQFHLLVKGPVMGWSNAEKEHVSKLEANFQKQVAFNKSLQDGLKAAIEEIKKLHKQNTALRTNVNLMNYQIDALGQYGRRESNRLMKVSEAKEGESDDAVKQVLETANFVLSQIPVDDDFSDLKDYKVTLKDIQRCHRVGDVKKAKKYKKPRPITSKFKD